MVPDPPLFRIRESNNQYARVGAAFELPGIAKVERQLGKKTLELEILKDAIDIAREKKLISLSPLPATRGMP